MRRRGEFRDRDHHCLSREEHHPGLEYDTWSYSAGEPLDGEAFRALVKALPEGVIRAKGVICPRGPGLAHHLSVGGQALEPEAGRRVGGCTTHLPVGDDRPARQLGCSVVGAQSGSELKEER